MKGRRRENTTKSGRQDEARILLKQEARAPADYALRILSEKTGMIFNTLQIITSLQNMIKDNMLDMEEDSREILSLVTRIVKIMLIGEVGDDESGSDGVKRNESSPTSGGEDDDDDDDDDDVERGGDGEIFCYLLYWIFALFGAYNISYAFCFGNIQILMTMRRMRRMRRKNGTSS